MIQDKFLQLFFDFSIIGLLFISGKVSLFITNVLFNSITLAADISVISYEGLLLVSKILTSAVLLITALYRLFDLVKKNKK